MTPTRIVALVGVLSCATAASGRAQDTQTAEQRAVVETAERLLGALSRRDTAVVRAIMAPGSTLFSVLSGSSVASLRSQTDSAFVASLAAGSDRLLERMWTPTVLVRGQIASVWTPYDFHINGTFSHCGVDHFSLIQLQGTWRVVSLSYSVERTGCSPSPLGPPKSP